MAPAAARRVLVFGLLWVLAACSQAADSRSMPARPGGSTASNQRVGNVDYIKLAPAAKKLGVQVTFRDQGRTLVLTGPGTKAEIEADTRDITVNGLRIFLGNPVTIVRGDLYVSRIDFERCLAPLLRPGQGVALLAQPKIIAIDPGHGGRDFGKVNEQFGINEKTYALDTALRLKKLLEADGYRVVMTRDGDRFIELSERPAIANRTSADLFVSLHFNALDKDRKTSGVEIYSFAPQHQRSTESWMPGQKDDTQSTPEPANQFDYWNSMLAQAVHRPFVTDLKCSDRGKKLMHLAVLRTLRCPGVLVECGFLSSDVEARKIATAAYRQQIAEALREGIRDYSETIATLRQKSAPAATSQRRRTSRSS